ncbi:hypothetical protein [Granulicella sp. dw_53]|uniref:hypothetical protein n=1 Tax=Granulicella sp. dw_53 TaxID=2719792 RepID=UPI001BD3A2FD|nr:hypothetical protein [Granulicella sp. dw_53]
MRNKIYFALLAAPLMAQEAPKLTNVEALTLKVAILEHQLAEEKQTIAYLKQQQMIQSLYINHGWRAEEVRLQVNGEGMPEVVPIKQPSQAPKVQER